MRVDQKFELEYFQAKVEHFAQKFVTDKVVESKMELQELFVQVAKCNSSELTNLAKDVLEAKATSKTLLGLVNEQASTQKVLESQIKVLELGISQNSKQDQPNTPQTSLETVREHIEAEVNRLLLKESDNNKKWFDEQLSPELRKIEEDRKHLETLRKQHEEVLAAQNSIYSTLTQLSQTVQDIPQTPIEKIGSFPLDQETTSNSVTKIAESLGDIVIRISTLERTSQDENPGVTNRFDNLEKFIQRILQTQAELQTQINNLPKNAHPQQGQQMPAPAPLEHPQTMPLINSLRYDMDNIKNDIFLHKQKAEDFFRKHDSLEKKVLTLEDGVALQKFGKAVADLSAQNFMATNFSKIGFPENSNSQGFDPIHQEFAPRANSKLV